MQLLFSLLTHRQGVLIALCASTVYLTYLEIASFRENRTLRYCHVWKWVGSRYRNWNHRKAV
jgi:hypothetical protein